MLFYSNFVNMILALGNRSNQSSCERNGRRSSQTERDAERSRRLATESHSWWYVVFQTFDFLVTSI